MTNNGWRVCGPLWGLALVCLAQAASAQTGGVEGRVRDDSGTPVYAASVVVGRVGETDWLRGTETDRLGYYRIENLPPGSYRLSVARIGFAEEVASVDVRGGIRVELDLSLRPEAVAVEGVSVEAGRSAERIRFAEDAGVTSRELAGDELKLIPGLAEADPVRAIEVLPGVVSTSDFSAAFNVRGGSADQNLILLDGIPVFNPFHLGGLFSVFNADMVARAELQSGGFPPRYGGRVSSVLEVETDPGSTDLRLDTGVSLLAARAALGGGMGDEAAGRMGLRRARWRISGRRSYFDQVMKPFFEFPYHFNDLQGAFEGWTQGGTRISFTAYTGDDVLDLTRLDSDDFPLRVFWQWGNDVVGGRWTVPRPGGGALELRAGYSRFSTALRFPDFDDSNFSSRIGQLDLGADLTAAVGRNWTVAAGASADRMSYDNLAVSGGTEFGQGDGRGWLLGSFAQARWAGGESWLAEGGIRVDTWIRDGVSTVSVPAPRLSVKRFLRDGDAAVKGSVGRYAQFLHSLRDEELPIGLDIWVIAGERAPHVVSDQAQVGVESYVGERWFVSLEGYLRTFDGVITNNLADDPNDDLDDLLPGTGRSYGADLFVRRSGQGVTGWLSLSWLRASRTFPDFRTGRLPAPETEYPPVFDRRIDLDLVLRAPLPGGVEGGLRWNFGTGLPHTRPLGSFAYYSPRLSSGGRLVWQGSEGGDASEAYAVVLGPRNGERYPSYHRLDLSARKTFFRSWGSMTPYVNLINLYNRKNVLFYFYELERDPPLRSGVSMFPVLPTLGVEVRF